MKQNRLVPWFGSDLAVAETVGKLLGKLAWCGVPFCGGCSALPFIDAGAGVASDMHRHVINLANVIRDCKTELVARLDQTLFHEDALAEAQRFCIEIERGPTMFAGERPAEPDPLLWAAAYFVCGWMGRGGHSGKGSEFTQGLAARYTTSGGDSAKRWRSAVESLEAWSVAMRPWSFVLADAFDQIERWTDDENSGGYIDAPWPDVGHEYASAFTDADQRRLAKMLRGFIKKRLVIRYGDHPLIRELYPSSEWTWHMRTTRNQRNGDVAEALITRNIGDRDGS